jgi:hypothetical protein
MIPTAATKSGTVSVEKIDAKASGYAVQQIASTKMSQTWFASQTGPIARYACSRRASERASLRRPSCHKAAPKSAPPSTA